MMKLVTGLPILVKHLADYVEVLGIDVESDFTKSWNCTDPWCCQHYYTHAKLGQFTNGMQKRLNHFHTSCLETAKDQMARQDSRHRIHEKGRNAECTYSSEIGTVKIDKP